MVIFRDALLRLLPTSIPSSFKQMDEGDRAWRGRVFLMTWSRGYPESLSWAMALVTEAEHVAEMKALVAEADDEVIRDAVKTRRDAEGQVQDGPSERALMARAMTQFERDDAGDWVPVGVWLATNKGLQARMLPGSASRDAFMKYVLSDASRPTAPYSTTKLGWPDWIEWATWSLSDMHVRMMVEVHPTLTLAQLYAREVLSEQTPASPTDPNLQPTLEPPQPVNSSPRELKGGLGSRATKSVKPSSPPTRPNPPTEATSAGAPDRPGRNRRRRVRGRRDDGPDRRWTSGGGISGGDHGEGGDERDDWREDWRHSRPSRSVPVRDPRHRSHRGARAGGADRVTHTSDRWCRRRGRRSLPDCRVPSRR